MEAKELIIGDWVQVPSELNRVRQIRITFDLDEAVLYQPIPLTAEIIRKNGFSKIGTIGDSYIHCIAKDNCYYEIEINLHDNTLHINHTWFIANDIHYVHELQHALRLCKIEKDIEL